MIIENTAKRLIAVVLTASNGALFSGSNELTASIYLESDDGDDGKFWDENSTDWQATPTTWPTASYIESGQWYYNLPATASHGRDDHIVHYTFADFTASSAVSTLAGGGEHYIWKSTPGLLTANGRAALTASVWNAVLGTDHDSAGFAGKILLDASGNLDATADAVWDEPMVLHSTSAGTAGRLLNDASGSSSAITAADIAAISASIWNAALGTDHDSAGVAGKLLLDASGNLDSMADAVWDEPMVLHSTSAGIAGRILVEATGSTATATVSAATIAAISASVWNALTASHTTVSTMAKFVTDMTGSLKVYESEPA